MTFEEHADMALMCAQNLRKQVNFLSLGRLGVPNNLFMCLGNRSAVGNL